MLFISTMHSPFPSKKAVSTESVILLIKSLSLSETIILSMIKNNSTFDNFIFFSRMEFIFSILPLCNILEYPCCSRVFSFSEFPSTILVSRMQAVDIS